MWRLWLHFRNKSTHSFALRAGSRGTLGCTRGDIGGMIWLLLLPHAWCARDADHKSLSGQDAADDLAPRFLPVLDKRSVPARFKHGGCRFNIFHIELKPCLRRRDILGPRILPKTGLRYLR